MIVASAVCMEHKQHNKCLSDREEEVGIEHINGIIEMEMEHNKSIQRVVLLPPNPSSIYEYSYYVGVQGGNWMKHWRK